MNLRDMLIMQITEKHLTDSGIYRVVDTERGKHITKYPVYQQQTQSNPTSEVSSIYLNSIIRDGILYHSGMTTITCSTTTKGRKQHWTHSN